MVEQQAIGGGTFDLDKPLETKNTATILDKKSLVRKKIPFVIKDVRMGKWEKLQIVLQDPAKDEYALDINNELHNELIEKFGNLPKKWIGQNIVLSSKHTRFEDRKTGEEKSGYTVFLTEAGKEEPVNPSDNDEEPEEEDLLDN